MSYVRFAAVCDTCNKKSEEYCNFIHCNECGDHVCPTCAVGDYDEDPPGRAMCPACAKFCACGVELLTEAEERNRVCRMCL